jgi:glycerophosphoryl diester phosphodiesterase
VPFVDKQPVQGFSAVLPAEPGSYWVMEDNGFGTKANSGDFLPASTT